MKPTLPTRLLSLSLALLLLSWCLRQDAQPDLYFHLAFGRTAASQPLPHTNTFLHPHPQHPFINPEWLYQLTTHHLHTLAGPPLLTLLKTLAATLATAALALATSPHGTLPRALALIPFIIVAGPRLTLRPELISLLGVSLHLLLLSKPHPPSKRTILSLTAFQLLWANSHGFSLLGPTLTAATILAHPRSPQRRNPLLTLLALQLTASLIHPYGPRAGLFLADLALRRLTDPDAIPQGAIVELLPPWHPDVRQRLPVALALAWALALLPLTALALHQRRLPRTSLIHTLLLTALALPFVRTLPLTAAAWTIPTAAGLRALAHLKPLPRLHKPALALTLLLALALARTTATGRFHQNADHAAYPGLGLTPFTTYPEAAAFWSQSPPAGNLFNTFGSGHFLNYAQTPKPFINGNLDLYPPSHLRHYHQLLQDPHLGDSLIDLGITDVLLDHRVETPPQRILELLQHPRWSLVHADPWCLLFRLDAHPTPLPQLVDQLAHRDFPDEPHQDPLTLLRPLRALHLLPPFLPQPRLRTHTARLLDLLDQPQPALQLARQAHQLNPLDIPTASALADLERRHGDTTTARQLLQSLHQRQPSQHSHLEGLAALELPRDPRRAIHLYAQALHLDPRSPTAAQGLLNAAQSTRDPVELRRAVASLTHTLEPARASYYLGHAALLERDPSAATEHLRHALQLEPSLHPARLLLGEALVRLQDLPAARDTYRRLAHDTPHDPEAWRNLGTVHLALQQPHDAIQAWEHATHADPHETLAPIHAAETALALDDLLTATRFARIALQRGAHLPPSLQPLTR